MTQSDPTQVQKKSIHPLVWVGIGCGALVLMGFVVLVAGGVYFGSKAKDFVEDMEANPALATAKLLAAVNPEIEVVDADESSQKVTIRHTKTGEEIVIDLEDLEQGRISFQSDEGEVNIGVAETDSGGGRLTVKTNEGTATFGTADLDDLPAWVPLYPGGEASSNFAMNTDAEASGVVTVTTGDTSAEILDFYREELEEAGFKVELEATASGPSTGGLITATKEDEGQTVSVMVSQQGEESTAAVTYNWKK